MSAILSDRQETAGVQATVLEKGKFACKLVIFVCTLGFAFPRLLAD